jgi:hypothetical protein
MRLSRLLSIGAALLLLLGTGMLLADEVTVNLESMVIESFDDPDARTWVVRGSKFITQDYPQTAYAPYWPDALFGTRNDNPDLRSFGIHAAFDRKGYNYLEIIPTVEGQDGPVPQSVDLPGRVRTIDLWVWGSNHNYYLEAHIRDHRGINHVLNLGDLQFSGWRNLRTPIPNYVPQAVQTVPRYRGLELTKLVLWTQPQASVDGFYVYFDQLKVLTDTFESRFDGDMLAEPDVIEDIWTNQEGQ